MEIVSKLDEWGKGAWILVMIGGFVVFWPLGLAILAYMIWSRRMSFESEYRGSGMRAEWKARRQEMREARRAMRDDMRSRCHAWKEEMRHHWHGHHGAFRPSGNAAFDDYKAETLSRLEEEQAEFSDFLDNLRKARDKAEFDDFMRSRRESAPRDDRGEGSTGPRDNLPDRA
ncbi:MAG TPA: DUF2852 domain-containing protein [Devosiaceae bacterium]